LGLLAVADAIKLAQERELDLVEVAPNSDPPVCRLLDYGKFRYVQAKKEREARKSQKFTVLREVRMRTRIGLHDRLAKTKTISKLLDSGAKVKVAVLFRGREVTHPELGITLLRGIAEDLKEEAKLERTPTMEGRAISIILTPANVVKVTQPPEADEDGEDQEGKELSSARAEKPVPAKVRKATKSAEADQEGKELSSARAEKPASAKVREATKSPEADQKGKELSSATAEKPAPAKVRKTTKSPEADQEGKELSSARAEKPAPAKVRKAAKSPESG